MFTRRNSLLSAGSVTTAQTLPSISSSTLRQDSIGKSGMWDRYQVCSLGLMLLQLQTLSLVSTTVLGQCSCEQLISPEAEQH